MSVRVSSAVWEHSRATGVALLVMLALADEASDHGDVTAYKRSRSHLARKCNTTEQTVRRSITQLTELGELLVLNVGSGRKSSDYRLRLPTIVHPDDAEGGEIEGGQNVTPGVSTATAQGARDVTPGVSPVIPPSSRSLPVSPVLPGLDATTTGADDTSTSSKGDGKPSPPGHEIAVEVWERSNPKPLTKFIAIRKIAAGALAAGYEPEMIVEAMLSVRTISTGWLESELKRRRPSPARPLAGGTSTRDAPTGLIVDVG